MVPLAYLDLYLTQLRITSTAEPGAIRWLHIKTVAKLSVIKAMVSKKTQSILGKLNMSYSWHSIFHVTEETTAYGR